MQGVVNSVRYAVVAGADGRRDDGSAGIFKNSLHVLEIDIDIAFLRYDFRD